MAFRFDKLTLKSQEAVQKAQDIAKDRGHQRLEPMHLLVALLDQDQPVVRSLLSQLGVNPAQLLRAAEQGLEALPKVSGGDIKLGGELNQVLDAAQSEADRLKDEFVSVEHLLLGLTSVKSRAQDVLSAVGVNGKDILGALQKVRGAHRVTDQTPAKINIRLSRNTAAISWSWLAKARWTRSSAATPKSAAWSRSSAAARKTIPCSSASQAWARPRSSRVSPSASFRATFPSRFRIANSSRSTWVRWSPARNSAANLKSD